MNHEVVTSRQPALTSEAVVRNRGCRHGRAVHVRCRCHVTHHGLFPTKGLTATISRWEPLKRRFARWNREAGWEVMGDDLDVDHRPGARRDR
jgi:hypothetical protein